MRTLLLAALLAASMSALAGPIHHYQFEVVGDEGGPMAGAVAQGSFSYEVQDGWLDESNRVDWELRKPIYTIVSHHETGRFLDFVIDWAGHQWDETSVAWSRLVFNADGSLQLDPGYLASTFGSGCVLNVCSLAGRSPGVIFRVGHDFGPIMSYGGAPGQSLIALASMRLWAVEPPVQGVPIGGTGILLGLGMLALMRMRRAQ